MSDQPETGGEVRRVVPFEVTRAEENGDGLTLEGYAAVFDSPTLIDSWEGTFVEKIRKGAFKKTLQERTPVLQFDHGSHPLIGSIPLGVIQHAREDDQGLFIRARLSDNWLVEPVRDAIRDGAVNGMSFRFRVVRDEMNKEEDPPERTLIEVAVPELGPVVFPAYEDTEVGVRDMTNELAARMEARLRDRPGTSDDAAEDGTSEEAAEATPDEPPERHSTDTQPAEDKEQVMETMTVEQRAARQDEIEGRLKTIAEEFEGAELPEEVREEWDALNDEYDAHERAIKETEQRQARIARLAGEGRGEPGDEQTDNRGRGPYVPPREKQRNIYDLAEARKRVRTVDELPQVYRENALRAVEQGRYVGVDKEDAQTHVERLLNEVDDEQGTLAKRILATGSPVYQRAFGKAIAHMSTAALSPEEQRALSVGVDGEGGYAVPFDLDPSIILTSDGSINPLRQIARVVQITTNEWRGVTSEGITVTRHPEAGEADDDSPTLEQPTVTPTRVQGFVPFSIEIDQDWNMLRTEMTALLNDAKEQEEAASFVNGDGTGNNPSGVIATLDASSEVGDGGTFGSGDVYDLEEELPPRFRARARWLANKSTYNSIRQFASADGHDLWERIGAGQPALMLGYPAHEGSEVPSHGTSGNRYLLFGDFNHFLIVDRVGMSVELVPHLFGANQRPTGQRGLYAIWRNSSVVLADNAFRVLTDGSA